MSLPAKSAISAAMISPAPSRPPLLRFAPSPTGYLHIGNARSALFNGLYARRHGGRFMLRYDDTDLARSKPEYAAAIAEDLAWLGITPDLVISQSQRLSLYDAAAEDLRAAGRLYPCYETADELDRRRKRQLARGLPPIYDRAALKLTAEDRAKLEAEGRRPHWRFLLEPRIVAWTDLIRGDAHVDCASLSDQVLIREDGTYLYHLPSVVDDAATGVTHIIRGEDHVTNTAVHIQIFQALGASLPPSVSAAVTALPVPTVLLAKLPAWASVTVSPPSTPTRLPPSASRSTIRLPLRKSPCTRARCATSAGAWSASQRSASWNTGRTVPWRACQSARCCTSTSGMNRAGSVSSCSRKMPSRVILPSA